jgi:toxin CcdB
MADVEARVVAQFHVYRLPDGALVLDLQSDVIDTGGRVVAPLLPVSDAARTLTRLEPVFEIEGSSLALHSGELAALPARLLSGPPVADLTAHDYAIRGALDMLFSGF